METYLDISPYISGAIIALVSYLIISHGLKRIANFTSFLVPLMAMIYLVVALVIIIFKIDMIPSIISKIISEAFNFKAFGWGIISSIIIGVQRGIFSSEAGMGTGAVASGTSDTKYPCKQGYIQMLGVYFTTFVICTSTAFVILTSNINYRIFDNPNGIEITLKALNAHLGNFGTIILIFAILSFAFSTIISGYYYGESNLKYLDKRINDKNINFLYVIVVLILFYGAIGNPNILWNTVDIGAGLLAIINCYSIFMLRKEVKKEFKKEVQYDR